MLEICYFNSSARQFLSRSISLVGQNLPLHASARWTYACCLSVYCCSLGTGIYLLGKRQGYFKHCLHQTYGIWPQKHSWNHKFPMCLALHQIPSTIFKPLESKTDKTQLLIFVKKMLRKTYSHGGIFLITLIVYSISFHHLT